MKTKYFFSSLTRISDLPESTLSVEPLSRREWATGDYVAGEVISTPSRLSRIELTSGRMVEVVEGDLIVGAFGVRYATLEAVGGWQGIGRDRLMEALTGAGLCLSERDSRVLNGCRTRMRVLVYPDARRPSHAPTVLPVTANCDDGMRCRLLTCENSNFHALRCNGKLAFFLHCHEGAMPGMVPDLSRVAVDA